jgi:hypothetical protein
MNTPRQPPGAPPPDEAGWIAQERALASPADPRDALLAHALRTLPRAGPPAGFAEATVRHVQAELEAMAPGEARAERLERALLRGLLLVLALSALGAVALFGGQWWHWAHQALGGEAAQWAAVGAACLALSAGLRALLGDGRGARPALA